MEILTKGQRVLKRSSIAIREEVETETTVSIKFYERQCSTR